MSHAQAVRLLREWRKVHVCHVGGGEIQAMHGGDATHTLAIGFTATGLNDPARSPYPDWDE